MAVLKPKRGDVWWVNFDPSVGSEVKKRRPAIVVSNNISNQYLSRVQVIPLSSNVSKVYPSECELIVKKQPCKAMADQIKTVSIERCFDKIGVITRREMSDVEKVIKIQLDLH